MTRMFPLWIMPLNIIQIHGTMCCNTMHQQHQQNYFKQYFNCYDAKNIVEANFLVIWGSLSPKLMDCLSNHLDDMLEKRYIIHIKGCELRINNTDCTASLDKLSTNSVIATCNLLSTTYKNIIEEARLCLRA